MVSMAKHRSSNTQRNIIIGLVVLAIAVLIALPVGLFSIAQNVGGYGGHDTIDQAFAACEQARENFRQQGRNCDPCGLACPSSALDGSYTHGGTGFTTEFDPNLCSSQYSATGNLLDVKSFCHNTIRLCEEQVRDGDITATYNVQNGVVQEITYEARLVYCDTGVPLSGSVEVTKQWRLICNSGYVIDGKRTSSSSRFDVGVCVTPVQQEETAQEMEANLRQVTISDPATAGKSVRITGVADITGVAGTYYVHAHLDPDVQNTFSVISGFGARDECGNNPNAATVIRTANTGDQLVFTLDIVAPQIGEGASSARSAYRVEVLTGCGGRVLARSSGSFTILPDEWQTDIPISFPVQDEYDIDMDATRDQLGQVVGTACSDGEQAFNPEGCAIAECVGGNMALLDPMICPGGVELPNPGERIGDTGINRGGGGGIADSFVGRFWCWIKTLFGGTC